MIFKFPSSVRLCGLFLLAAEALAATPRLFIDQTSFAVLVAPGSNGTAQTANAFDHGDGLLNLTVSSSQTWLVPTIEKTTSCSLLGQCTPIQMALNTASLAAGTYTGLVTVSDSKALDAPQNITVTVAVGGNVPSKLEYYLAPGGSVSTSFTTGSGVKAAVSANTPWLAASTTKTSVTLTLTAANTMSASDYNGTITVSGSAFSADNKQISVLLHVSTQPILQLSSNALEFSIAQGGTKLSYPVATANAGQGTLTVSSVTAAAGSGTWLSAATVTGGFTVTADPTGLSPNVYQGTVTVASNADNSSVVLPVELTVEPPTSPVAFAGGAVNNGTFASGESLAQGDIIAVFGDQFTYGAAQAAANLPLPNTLGDMQVIVNGKAVPLFYGSPGQINFEVPIDATIGDGTLQVMRGATGGNLIHINISARQPRFLTGGGQYAIMTTPAGSLTGIPGSPVKAGDVVVIYMIGLGPTTPVVPSGTATPSTTLSKVPGTTQLCFGVPTPFSTPPPCATPDFVGLTPGFSGLYQVNVTIPSGLKSGTNPLLLLVDNVQSDQAQIPVQ